MYTSYAGKARTNSNMDDPENHGIARHGAFMTSHTKTMAERTVDWHSPQTTGAREEEELMQKSQRGASHATNPLLKLRHLCLARGASGIMGLARVFRRTDNESNHINKEEFVNSIKETGLEYSHQDAEELFDVFDHEGRGSIDVDAFLKEIRPPMSDNRRAIVEQAFRKLDKNGDGVVPIEALRDAYDVKCDPRYMNGQDSADKILDKFLTHFEPAGTLDGKVTLEEFMNYYSGISVSIDNDCYFDLMIRQAYKL